MHREFDAAAEPFERRSAAGVFAFTALLVALLVADLWPPFANWLNSLGFETPTWVSRELFGVRYALLAAVLGGARVLFTSLDRAFDGKIGADLAVAIACLAAILIGEPLVAAEVVVIGLIGECLEAATFDRTQRALRKLAELFPTRTWVLRDGVEVRTFTRDLLPGDHVVVKPGGKIPVDGVVLDGRSTVDASALTGESYPLDKAPGDAVLAGSVNQFGALTVRADRVAKQTVAGRVLELTAAALKEKAPLERYADRLARRFLPIVLGLAALAFLGNVAFFGTSSRSALYPALAVLVVACPCPLVLATPAAVIAALGRLAGTGALLKGGAALERLAEVTHVAFDKTGTLTTGLLELGDVIPLGNATRDDVLSTAALAEQKSEHPLAKVILKSATDHGFMLCNLDQFEAHAGGGVSAVHGDDRLLVGNRRLFDDRGLTLSAETLAAIERLDVSGQTPVIVARNGAILGVFGARDTLRPEAAGVIDDLKALGLGVSLLTGDRPTVANAIAARAGIADVHAELLPAEKAERLSSLSSRPLAPRSSPLVAFIGDGINDAPALAKATVGIAVGSGTEIAAETGDVVMMGEPLRPLPFLVRLSRQAVVIIRQNIVWFGFGVNLVGVAVAGFLWPLFAPNAQWFENAPLFAVVYHQIGSLAVLLNSMRLLTFERVPSSRWRSFLGDANRWLNTVHIDNTLHELGHRWKPIAASLAVIAFLAWVLSGLTQVNANEVAVVQRFGAVQADLGPGLHLRWPWPIEACVKLQPANTRTVEIGFRRLPDDVAARLQQARLEQQRLKRPGADQTWSSVHANDINRLNEESLCLTGDGNLVEVFATLRYRVDNPRAFLFNSSDVEGLLRTASQAALRELIAAAKFEELLTSRRGTLESQVFAAIRDRLAVFPLGITLDGLTVHDLHPPQEVVAAYHAVAEAIQKRDRAVNEAQAEATRIRRRAADDALYTVSLAEADAYRKVSEAVATRDVFAAWQNIRTTLTPAEEAALDEELSKRASRGEDRTQVAAEMALKKKQLLTSRRSLTDLRLTLAAAVAALAGRDKILVDAENVPGRRTLFLADPDAFKLPAGLTKPEEPPK